MHSIYYVDVEGFGAFCCSEKKPVCRISPVHRPAKYAGEKIGETHFLSCVLGRFWPTAEEDYVLTEEEIRRPRCMPYLVYLTAKQ